jgi:uridine kinase
MNIPFPSLGRPPLLVGIGGGTGKSGLAQALVTLLGPAQTALLAHSAYHRDGGARTADASAAVNYAVPDAFDRALFLEHLAALRAGHPVRPPSYCFVTHRRTGPGPIVAPRAIVLIEGALLLWEPAVRAALDLKIYLDAVGGNRLGRRPALSGTGRGVATDHGGAPVTAPARDALRDYVEPTRAMADLVLSGAGPVQPLAEIAAAVVLDRLARHHHLRQRLAS